MVKVLLLYLLPVPTTLVGKQNMLNTCIDLLHTPQIIFTRVVTDTGDYR